MIISMEKPRGEARAMKPAWGTGNTLQDKQA